MARFRVSSLVHSIRSVRLIQLGGCAGAGLLALTWVAGGAQAAGSAGPSAQPLAPEASARITSAASRALVHIADARGDLHEKELERARQDLDLARHRLAEIQAAIPTATVKDRLWVARKHLEYETPTEVLADLAPIERSLALLDGFVPTQPVRADLAAARQALAQGDRKAAVHELAAADGALVFAAVDGPVARIEADIGEALSRIAGGEPDPADQALRSAENDIQELLVAVGAAPGMGAAAGSAR